MRHRATRKFWVFYGDLPHDIQKLADQNYALLKADHQRGWILRSRDLHASRAYGRRRR